MHMFLRRNRRCICAPSAPSTDDCLWKNPEKMVTVPPRLITDVRHRNTHSKCLRTGENDLKVRGTLKFDPLESK